MAKTSPLARARRHMETRLKQYVVGYSGAGNALYVRHGGGSSAAGGYCFDPMSLRAARAFLKTMPCAGACIFKIVPIEVNR